MGYAGFRRCAAARNGAALHDVVDVYAQPCAVGSIERECAFECFGQAGPVLSAGSQVDNSIACAADAVDGKKILQQAAYLYALRVLLEVVGRRLGVGHADAASVLPP